MIDDLLCEGGFTQVFDHLGVFHCNLNQTAQQPIQPGDVLGLEIAPRSNTLTDLSFASVIRGPTNYVFIEEQVISSPRVVLLECDLMNQDLPQITFEISGMLSLQIPVYKSIIFILPLFSSRERLYQWFLQYSNT